MVFLKRPVLNAATLPRIAEHCEQSFRFGKRVSGMKQAKPSEQLKELYMKTK